MRLHASTCRDAERALERALKEITVPPRRKWSTPEKRARIGERIKVAAYHAGLTLKELAEAVDTPQTIIYQYVRGVTTIPSQLLDRIAAVTGVHRDFFDPDQAKQSTAILPESAPAAPGQEPDNCALEHATVVRIQIEFEHLHQLAEAYNYPKRNRNAYLSALEQMLALARATEDRRKMAWAYWMIGRARMEASDWEASRQSLETARDLFAAEGMETYRMKVLLDLAQGLNEQGLFGRAQAAMEEALCSTDPDIQWRALISLGNLHYRQHNFGAALHHFNQAAAFIGQSHHREAPEKREEAVLHLINHIADVVRATGHHEEAMLLWARCLEQAVRDRNAEVLLESLIEVARCCHLTGRISKAKQHLEQAAVLARLLFEDEARLSVARAHLAHVLVTMGALDEARENAREALQIAHRVRGPRPTILAALAQAETSLMAGHWKEALLETQDALHEAQRTQRTRELAQTHEVRARAFLQEAGMHRAADDRTQEQAALASALQEATHALDIAARAESIHDRIAAHLTLARCYYHGGHAEAAEQEVRASLDLIQNGAVGLNRLMGREATCLTDLLRSPEINVQRLFASHRVQLPFVEWQARYLEGKLLAHRVGSEAAFAAMRHALMALQQILNDLSPAEATRFRQQHPEVSALIADLQRHALTEEARQEMRALLMSTPCLVSELTCPGLLTAE
ncbi:MAG: helix-turn-helix transcriptional regulator [Chloroherpetonaceae bacterium]|nr:helix-turn-helix domain-containing protein [Chthonomonadaceae bacterium]MDW8209237.1 helix-turn-helix transcriptional regulator [Chloroherpetonaceae bacterium]